MSSHAVLIGYSTRGRVVLSSLFAAGIATDLTVVDSDPARVAQAEVDGVPSVAGEEWRLDVLWSAGVHTADHIVVAVADDALALRVTSVVRSVSETAVITTVVHNTELRRLMEFLGADEVVGEDSTDEPHRDPGSHAFAQLPEQEWVVAERAVVQEEVGCSPLACGHDVLAVVRDGHRIWVEDPAVGELRDGDRLLVLTDEALGG